MSAASMMFKDAQVICRDPATANDGDLVAAWHSHASQISYHHADDSGKEWGLTGAMMADARDLEVEIKRRGLPRPTGQYLMSANDRIFWPAEKSA